MLNPTSLLSGACFTSLISFEVTPHMKEQGMYGPGVMWHIQTISTLIQACNFQLAAATSASTVPQLLPSLKYVHLLCSCIQNADPWHDGKPGVQSVQGPHL
jgi:hypothetical protein